MYLCRYIILAASAVPDGCTDAKVITDKVLGALPMEEDSYRLGNNKVFFKAGVLGSLEDWRDERLGKIMTMFQSLVRGCILRDSYQRLMDQRCVFYAAQCVVFAFKPCGFLYILRYKQHLKSSRVQRSCVMSLYDDSFHSILSSKCAMGTIVAAAIVLLPVLSAGWRSSSSSATSASGSRTRTGRGTSCSSASSRSSRWRALRRR